MKKALALLLCLCVIFALSACGGDGKNQNEDKVTTTELALDERFTIDGFAEFSIFKIFTTPKISPTMGGYFCFNNDNSGETYIDVILEWKNTSGKSVDSSSLLTFTAIDSAGDEHRQSFYTVENSNGTDLNQHVEIEPNSTVRIHCALSVPETEKSLILKLTSHNHEFYYDYTLGTTLSTAETLQIGVAVDHPEHASLSLTEVMYTDDVLPSNTEGQYYHYTIKDPDNTYLVIKFDVTNHQETAVSCDEFVNINVLYQSKYNYTGSVYVEDADGTGFDPYEEVIPLSTRLFYYLVEVPKTVTEQDAVITIAFAQQEYTYTFEAHQTDAE